jgi:hypothetical protein
MKVMNRIQRNYYCLIAGLPDIVMDQRKISFTLSEFKNELQDTLHKDDYKLIELLFLSYDNVNLLNLLLKNDKPYNSLGKYTRDELEVEIKEPEFIEEYLKVFIEDFKASGGTENEQSWENQLTQLYLDYVQNVSNPFLKDWFSFEKTLKNVLTAYNCKKHQLSMDDNLIGDGDIVETLKKSHARDFGLSSEVDYIEKLISIIENKNLFDREKNIDLLKWNYLDELTTFHYFSIEAVLSFMIKLIVLNRWMELDKETGKELFKKFLYDLKTTYKFPIEFNIYERRK